MRSVNCVPGRAAYFYELDDDAVAILRQSDGSEVCCLALNDTLERVLMRAVAAIDLIEREAITRRTMA